MELVVGGADVGLVAVHEVEPVVLPGDVALDPVDRLDEAAAVPGLDLGLAAQPSSAEIPAGTVVERTTSAAVARDPELAEPSPAASSPHPASRHAAARRSASRRITYQRVRADGAGERRPHRAGVLADAGAASAGSNPPAVYLQDGSRRSCRCPGRSRTRRGSSCGRCGSGAASADRRSARTSPSTRARGRRR